MKLRSLIPHALLALTSLAFVPGARGQVTASLSVVHSFGALNSSEGDSDGANPIAGLIPGTDGNFYGTANAGGALGAGVVYRLTPAGTLTTLHAFGGGGDSGDHPNGGVIQGSDGSFYGTNDAGSTYSSGTVYRLTSAGALNSLYTFGGDNGHGALPKDSLVEGSDGNFYGTTYQGGTSGNGTVFQITPAGALTTLYDFGDSTGHGSYPRGSLVQGNDGNYYGTTQKGGDYGQGTVFQVTSAGVLTTLFSFGGDTDHGTEPYAGLIQGADGNFYGTTYFGGDYGQGTVFQITSAGVLTTLFSFGATASFGTNPYAGVTQGSDGNFYGVTATGGTNGNGTVFQITSAGALTTLYSFGAADASGFNADGISPEGRLLEAADGTFYGTTNQGGTAGEGTIFQLTVSPTITSAVSATGTTGTAFSYQAAATFDPTSFGATGLPAGLSIDPTSGVIAGTPTAAGTFSVGLSAGNAGGSGTAALVLTITESVTAIPAPVITGSFVASATEGQTFTYQINASNAPTSYAATGLPAGLSVDATSGAVSGAPTAVGTFAIVLSATNAGGTGTAALTLTVAANLPVAALTATLPGVVAGSGGIAEFTLSLSAAQASDVVVSYAIKGSAVNGTDYTLLTRTKKIKAGKTSKLIKIVPLGEGAGAGIKRTVVLTLTPGSGYAVGTNSRAKVTIYGQ